MPPGWLRFCAETHMQPPMPIPMPASSRAQAGPPLPGLAPIRAVSFDLDGTLVDTVADIHAAANALMAELGRAPLERAAILRFIGSGERELIRQCLAASGSLADAAEVDAVHPLYRRAYLHESGRRARLYPGLFPTLDSLRARGLALAVVTNKPDAVALPLLHAFKLHSYFDCIIGGDSTAQRKPHPLPLLTACERLDAAPGQTVHVGDSGIDIATADAAGCRAIFIRHGYPRDYRPPAGLAAIDHLDELPTALARIGRLPQPA